MIRLDLWLPDPLSFKLMEFELRQTFTIESARKLPKLDKTHPCSDVHGHSFKIIIIVRGSQLPTLDWVIDYNDIINCAHPILAEIDHKLLNQVPGLENPTTENLCIWLFEKLKSGLPGLWQIIISETPSTECRYPVR